MIVLALTIQCLTGTMNVSEMMDDERGKDAGEAQLPRPSTRPCGECPQVAPFPAPAAPIILPRSSAQWHVRQGIFQQV